MKHKNKQKPWPMTPPPPSAAAAVACANLTTFEPRAATPNAKMPTPQLSRLADLTDHDAIDEEEGSYVDLEGARGPSGEVVDGKGRRGHPRERRGD